MMSLFEKPGNTGYKLKQAIALGESLLGKQATVSTTESTVLSKKEILVWKDYEVVQDPRGDYSVAMKTSKVEVWDPRYHEGVNWYGKTVR